MIYHINGKLCEVTPAYAVVDCGGVGYQLQITLQTYSKISGQKQVHLFVHPIYKEDSQVLFGFVDTLERDLFRQLILVSGVGGNTARVILSSASPTEVVEAIATENVKMLQSIKGIGSKTAQRIIIDLKDKVSGLELSSALSTTNVGVRQEAQSALEVLGYQNKQTEKVLQRIISENPDASVELLIKEVLKRL